MGSQWWGSGSSIFFCLYSFLACHWCWPPPQEYPQVTESMTQPDSSQHPVWAKVRSQAASPGWEGWSRPDVGKSHPVAGVICVHPGQHSRPLSCCSHPSHPRPPPKPCSPRLLELTFAPLLHKTGTCPPGAGPGQCCIPACQALASHFLDQLRFCSAVGKMDWDLQ